jgi:uncharacterized protein YwgA
MDEKKLERTIEFILDNQTQFSADIQQLKELHIEAEKRATADEKRINQIEKGFVGLFNLIDETSKISKENTEAIKELRQSQKETDERSKETNERLNAVIVMFEKYLDNQNGKSK